MKKNQMFKSKGGVPLDYFDNKQVRTNLKNQAIQSGGISVVSKAFSTVVLIGGVVILARLLTPADFGLVAMVSVFTNIFSVFQDIGLTDATIQAKIISHKQASTLFWINSAFGLLITLVLIALSPAIAWFYKKPQLTLITVISSLSFIFWGLTTQHVALLKRQMSFFKVAIIDIISIVFSTVASIILAMVGWRYWAIVFRTIFYGVIKWILAWIFCRWRPGPPQRNSGVRPLLKFGANSIGFYIVNYIASTLDKTIIGKKSGAEQLGHYSRAYYLSTIPSDQSVLSIFHVATSTLSKLREEPGQFRRYYLNAISAISFLGMPLTMYMVAMSRELVYLLLGPQWNQAAKYFFILSLAAGMNILYSTNGWLHISLGRSDRWMRWGIFSLLTMVAGFAIGSFFGTIGVSIAYAVATNLLTFPSILYAGRPIGLRFGEVFSSIWKSTFAAILASIIIGCLKNWALSQTGLMLRLLISLLSFLGIYLVLIIIIFRGSNEIRQFLSLSRIMLLKKRGS
jgi:O-antigen/teichoic acid export membrane protein